MSGTMVRKNRSLWLDRAIEESAGRRQKSEGRRQEAGGQKNPKHQTAALQALNGETLKINCRCSSGPRPRSSPRVFDARNSFGRGYPRMIPDILLGRGAMSATSSKVEDEFQFVSRRAPQFLRRGLLLSRKEATFSPRSPRKGVDRYGPMLQRPWRTDWRYEARGSWS
jgi:hypothetical protein